MRTERFETQTFNDGLLSIYRISNTAAAGEMPSETPVLRASGIPYANRIVGMSRYWAGLQSNARIDRLLRIPRGPTVQVLDSVVTENGDTYQVKQVQYPPDVEPPSVDLSLQLVQTSEDLDPLPAPEEDPEEGGDTGESG